jgi:hypothetical protein
MSWLGLGLGQFGSDLGVSKDIALDWRARQQQLQRQAWDQKMQEILGPLRVQQIKEELRQSALPQYKGQVDLPGGGTGAMMYDPTKGTVSAPPVVPGMSKEVAKAQVANLAAQAPKEFQGAISALTGQIDAGFDPQSVVNYANAALFKALSTQQTQEGKVRFKFEPEKGVITDAQGKPWSVYDPELPPDLQQFVAAEKQRKDAEFKRKGEDEARRGAQALSHALAIRDASEALKEYGKLFDTARRGVAGHTYLKAIRDQVATAAKGGGEGTTAGDRIIADSFMQLMFGPEAKGIRGSTTVMDAMLRQGGWGDEAIAALNKALSGGRLSQNVRNQIKATSEEQIGIWDAYVVNYAKLATDKKSQDLTTRYLNTVGADITGAAPQTPTVGPPTKPPPTDFNMDRKRP